MTVPRQKEYGFNSMNLDALKAVGLTAAKQGGEILRARFGKIFRVEKKGAIDLVTEADTECEAAVIRTIRSVYPDHGILAEESGRNPGKSPCQWIIDPLDGTTNFSHGLPIFSVSIALAYQNQVVLGIVFNPASGELFSATSGQGAFLNAQPIRVSTTPAVSESLLVTGFPYDLKTMIDPLMRRFSTCLQACQGVRRLGSAALDLCYVASGRFDGFWEQNLKPWDTAAGMLIAREAGARITDFSGNSFAPDMNRILATNGLIHSQMMTLLN